MAYDASKALFEDVLGFPNVESLKQGTRRIRAECGDGLG